MSTDNLNAKVVIPAAVPVRPCAPWCVDGEEKHAEEHPDDRSCWSDFEHIPRSLGKPERVLGVWSEDWMTVVARRRPNETTGRVNLHVVTEDIEVELTPAEARHLARELTRHADIIEP